MSESISSRVPGLASYSYIYHSRYRNRRLQTFAISLVFSKPVLIEVR